MSGSPRSKYLKRYINAAGMAGIRFDWAVETGTYQGDGTPVLAKLFPKVHTIELSPKWHKYSSERLKKFKNIFCHQGDSAEILEDIAPSIRSPALFFLDAHFAGGDTAHGEDEVPLLRELTPIARRPYADLIVIDDARLLGKTGECGSTMDPRYPPMVFDWRDVTINRIASVVNARNRTYWLYEDDRVVIFRRLSWLQAATLKTIFNLNPLVQCSECPKLIPIVPGLGRSNETACSAKCRAKQLKRLQRQEKSGPSSQSKKSASVGPDQPS